ncbi:MAG: PhoH family protein [Victivallales bacterium]|jgi:PhoH-like ATPase|nr:PhoH family protein [Victivallales bacterium]
MAVKAFVLDTNVLLHNAQSIESFQDNDVVIPMAAIEELDKFKKNSDELGRNARQVIRRLDKLRQSSNKPGQLRQGVSLSTISPTATGKLFVLSAAELGNGEMDSKIRDVFRLDFGGDTPDNRILKVAFGLREKGRQVVFISKDINLRLKADAIGLKVMDFERGKVDERALYTGFQEGTLTAAELDALYKGHGIPNGSRSLYANEYMVYTSSGGSKQSALARLDSDNILRVIDTARTNRVWNVAPRNKEQRMALDLLLNPDIRLVTLVGGAGTGKTLLALAAAMQLVLNENSYDRILVSRPIIPLGNDIGFLPGDKSAKLASWMQPIFDNLEFLLGSESERKAKSSSHYSLEGLLNSGKLELEALTYIRGRSIPRQFVIVDEAQNLTPHEVKTIISRSGEDTKMVLTGDPHQIDNPYLDASSNGLSYTVERMKGQSLFGHITLSRSERSELSALAASLL